MKAILAAVLLSLSLAASAQSKPDILEIVVLDGDVSDGMANFVAKTVDEINANDRVKAVLLIVNTPGGYVTSSGAIYEDLSRLKVPVWGWCDSMCASGGMYLLMSPTVKGVGVRGHTIAGSIGVVAQYWRYYRLLDFLRFDVSTFTSGSRKATGNPTVPATDEENARIQARINSLAGKFHDLVAKSRGSKIKDWDAVKSADIFIGRDAVDIGLVDAVMSKQEAVDKAKSLSGSKLIFTRDEIKKMSAMDLGSGSGLYRYKAPSSTETIMESLFAIWRGESVRLQYRALGL